MEETLVHHFHKALQLQDDGSILYRKWDGTRVYTPSDSGYLPPAGDISTLEKAADGSYILTDDDNSVNKFNTHGQVVAVLNGSNVDGEIYYFTYTADSVTVTDSITVTDTKSFGTLTRFSILTYNSLNPMTSSLGTGWSHNYEIALQDQGNNTILLKEGQSRRLYTPYGSGYVSQAGDYSILVKNSDGTFVITKKRVCNSIFDQWGRIVSRIDKSGTSMTFAYSNGNLSSVTDGAGRTTTFAYEANNNLTSISDPAALLTPSPIREQPCCRNQSRRRTVELCL